MRRQSGQFHSLCLAAILWAGSALSFTPDSEGHLVVTPDDIKVERDLKGRAVNSITIKRIPDLQSVEFQGDFSRLQSLAIYQTGLTSLEIPESLSHLQSLFLTINPKLSKISNLSILTRLAHFHCSSNALSRVELPELPSLTRLYIHEANAVELSLLGHYPQLGYGSSLICENLKRFYMHEDVKERFERLKGRTFVTSEALAKMASCYLHVEYVKPAVAVAQ